MSGELSEKGTGYPFIQQHGQDRHNGAFYQIQRRHAEEYKGGHGVDGTVDRGAIPIMASRGIP